MDNQTRIPVKQDVEDLSGHLDESLLVAEYQAERLVGVVKLVNENGQDTIDLSRFEQVVDHIRKAKELL